MPQCPMVSPSIHETLNPEVCHCSPDIRRGVIEGLPFMRHASPESLTFFSKNLRSEGMPEVELPRFRGSSVKPLFF